MGEGNFRPPTESTPLNRSPKKLVQVITSVVAPVAEPNLVQIHPWVGLLGKRVKCNEDYFLFIYLFVSLFNTF